MSLDLRARAEALLSRGSPCRHEFLTIPGGYMVCRDCLKLQTPNGDICLLCEAVGQRKVTLVHCTERCEGSLCPSCWEAFSLGEPLLGWRVECPG